MVGNKSNYVENDLLRAMIRIPMSRASLVDELGLGEGSVRTILDALKEKGFISSTNSGHFLHKKGRDFLDQLRKRIEFPKKVTLDSYKQFKSVGLLLRNIKYKKPGFKERDIAVRCGAEGALLLRSGFKIDGYCFKELEKEFRMKKNDLIVVCFAKKYSMAENAALEVAKNLNKKIGV